MADETIGGMRNIIESEEEILDGLREALEDIQAGRVRPADEFMREFAQRHNLPESEE